jgi:cysteine desulfurase
LSTDIVTTALYLDYYARTPIHPAAQATMAPLPAESYGNPSSGHWAGADGA